MKRGYLISLLLAGCPLWADELSLDGGARLSGSVRSINADGVVELISELSPDPVRLKAGVLKRVDFAIPQNLNPPQTTLVELVNGDLLPVKVRDLDENFLHVDTDSVGQLSIERKHLKSMQFGVKEKKVLYRGPVDANEWSRDAKAKYHWTYEDGGLVARGGAVAMRDFSLPRQFVLKFSLKWQGMPGYRIYFADPLAPQGARSDRYMFQFGVSGFEVRREFAGDRKPHTVILLPRTPDLYPERKLDVELRVDRLTSRLQLSLNGEDEGMYIDTVSPAPIGNGIRLVGTSNVGSSQEIRSIEILELDRARGRYRAEDIEDDQHDSLISRDDDRWSGSLVSIRSDGDEDIFVFKSDFQNEPFELLGDEVSTVFFASAGHKNQEPLVLSPPYVVKLWGEGSLRVSSTSFSDSLITTSHPLLGELKIEKDAISALEYASPVSKKEGEK